MIKRIWPYIALVLLSIICFLVSIWCNAVIQSFLVSFSSGILASLLIFFLIDRRLSKYSNEIAENKEKSIERNSILNSDSIIQCLLPQYKLLFNQLTIPWNVRAVGGKFSHIDSTELHDFSLQDLIDMFKPNITLYGAYGETSLDVYSHIDDRIIHSFESILMKNSFNHYPTILEKVKKIIDVSITPNGIAALRGIEKGNPSIPKIVEESIQSYEGMPYDDISSKKYNGNVFINVLYLYLYLEKMKNAIQEYESEITQLRDDQT